MSFPTRRFGGSYKRLLSVRRIRSWRSRDVGYVYGFVRTFGAYISIDSTVGKWPIVSGIFYEIPHGSSACSLNRIKRPVSPLSVANNAFISSDTIDITKRLNRILRAHVHLVCKGERSMNRCFYRRCMLAVVYIRNSRSSYLYMIVSKLQPCNSNSKAESDGGKVHQILPKVFFFDQFPVGRHARPDEKWNYSTGSVRLGFTTDHSLTLALEPLAGSRLKLLRVYTHTAAYTKQAAGLTPSYTGRQLKE